MRHLGDDFIMKVEDLPSSNASGCCCGETSSCVVERSALTIALKARTQQYHFLATAQCFRRWQLRSVFQKALDRLKRLVHQRTACLEVIRMAYVRDVLSVKTVLEEQQDAEVIGSAAVSSPVFIPEEINRAPSADLRHAFRDMNENAEVEVMTRTDKGVFHRAGVGTSAGVGAFPPLASTGEARVDDLSLGVYAPSSHALVIKPCEACLGVATFVFRRNRRVEEALGRLDRSEWLEEQVDSLKASNAQLLGRLLPAEARLQLALERLREAEGSSENGRDWLVRELARVSQEVHALHAGRLEREEAVLEAHRKMDLAGDKHKADAKTASKLFLSRLSEAHEELETLREALLQSNADTRGEASKAAEMENEACFLSQSVERLQEELRRRTILLADAERRAATAEAQAVELRGQLRKTTEEGVEKELKSGRRLHEAALALEEEEKVNARLAGKLDDVNAHTLTLHERLFSVTTDMVRKDAAIAAATASTAALASAAAVAAAEHQSAERQRREAAAEAAAASAPTPAPPLAFPEQATATSGTPMLCGKVDACTSMSASPSSDDSSDAGSIGEAVIGGGVSTARGKGPTVDGRGKRGESGGESTGGSGGRRGADGAAVVRAKVRLAVRGCGAGVKRGLVLAALERRKGLGVVTAIGVPDVAKEEIKLEEREEEEREKEQKDEEEGEGEGGGSVSTVGGKAKEEGVEREAEEKQTEKERGHHEDKASPATLRPSTQVERGNAADSYQDGTFHESPREISSEIFRLDAFECLMKRLRSAVNLLTGSIPGDEGIEESDGVWNNAEIAIAPIDSPDNPATASTGPFGRSTDGTVIAPDSSKPQRQTDCSSDNSDDDDNASPADPLAAKRGNTAASAVEDSSATGQHLPRTVFPVSPDGDGCGRFYGDGGASSAAAAAAAETTLGAIECIEIPRSSNAGSDTRRTVSRTRDSADDMTTAGVRSAGMLLIANVEEATGGVLRLRARLAAALKGRDVGRTVREAERVRTAKLVSALRSEAQDLRRKPRKADAVAQTALQGSDLLRKEALAQSLEKKNKGVELGFEMFRQDAERRRDVEVLKSEENTLEADKRLHASHVREGHSRAYCRRLEARVATLLAHRGALRKERQVLRAAVRASFQDAAARENQRMVNMRTAATQVKCAVCAIRGGEHTAVVATAGASPRSGSGRGPACPPAMPGEGGSLGAAEDGGGVFPLAVVAARVQQKRFANADGLIGRSGHRRGAVRGTSHHPHRQYQQKGYPQATRSSVVAANPKRGRKERPASAGQQHPHQFPHPTARALTTAAKLARGKKQRPASAGRVDSRPDQSASAPALATTNQSSSSDSSDGDCTRDLPHCKDDLGDAESSSGGHQDGGENVYLDGESAPSGSRGIGRGGVGVGAGGGGGAAEDSGRGALRMPGAVEKVRVSLVAHRRRGNGSDIAPTTAVAAALEEREEPVESDKKKKDLWDRKEATIRVLNRRN